MIDRKRPRLASSRILSTPSAKSSWLSLSLFANPVPTRDDTPASRKRVFVRETRRFAAFHEKYENSNADESHFADCLSAPSILESRAARAGTADRAGLAPRTDRRAHANPSDWSGRDSNEMFGATYVPARDRRASHARRTRDRPRVDPIGRRHARRGFSRPRSRVDAPTLIRDPIQRGAHRHATHASRRDLPIASPRHLRRLAILTGALPIFFLPSSRFPNTQRLLRRGRTETPGAWFLRRPRGRRGAGRRPGG